MKQSLNPTALPPATLSDSAPTSRCGNGTVPASWQLVVRHPSRLETGRLSELEVEARSAGPAAPGGVAGREPVLVRPCLPGVVVAPVEAALDPAQGKRKAVFRIAAVVGGKVPGAGVEVWRNGQLMQTIATPMHAAGRGPAPWLYALALAVTAGLMLLGRSTVLADGAAARGLQAVWPAGVGGTEAAAEAVQTGAAWLTAAAARGEVVIATGFLLAAVAFGASCARRGGRPGEVVGPFPSVGAPPRRGDLPQFLSRVDPEELEQIHQSHPRMGTV